jgi:hypothetical protein
MKKNYDFSKGVKNPYYKKLKDKKIQLTEEVSFELKDLVLNIARSNKKSNLEKQIKLLQRRISNLEKRVK